MMMESENDVMENEAIWMIGIYVQLVWDYVICKKKHLKLETMKSDYQMKYLTHQKSNSPDLIDNNILINLVYICNSICLHEKEKKKVLDLSARN
jgi:hypothetical protein